MEKLRTSVIPETGPKPLTDECIRSISEALKTGIVLPHGRKKLYFGNDGHFFLTGNGAGSYWSQDLLRFNPDNHLIETNKCGNLNVHVRRFKTKQEPKIIIESKDIRKINSIMKGEVNSSGFVFEKGCRHFSLEGQNLFSPEEVEEMLLRAERNSQSELTYRSSKGFAKVDPSLAGRDVLLMTFRNPELDKFIEKIRKDPTGDIEKYFPEVFRRFFRREDAVVIDITEGKLVPRVFYTLNPDK